MQNGPLVARPDNGRDAWRLSTASGPTVRVFARKFACCAVIECRLTRQEIRTALSRRRSAREARGGANRGWRRRKASGGDTTSLPPPRLPPPPPATDTERTLPEAAGDGLPAANGVCCNDLVRCDRAGAAESRARQTDAFFDGSGRGGTQWADDSFAPLPPLSPLHRDIKRLASRSAGPKGEEDDDALAGLRDYAESLHDEQQERRRRDASGQPPGHQHQAAPSEAAGATGALGGMCSGLYSLGILQSSTAEAAHVEYHQPPPSTSLLTDPTARRRLRSRSGTSCNGTSRRRCGGTRAQSVD